jgi:hypothetical protein
MKVIVTLFAALTALLASTAPVASADSVIEVGMGACVFGHGGNVTVPAGSTVAFRVGVFEYTRGGLQDFLNAQTTTLTIDDAAPVDLTYAWPSPSPGTGDYTGAWVSTIHRQTGRTLGFGDSVHILVRIALAHALPDALGPFSEGGAGGKPVFESPVTLLGCTVTGA